MEKKGIYPKLVLKAFGVKSLNNNSFCVFIQDERVLPPLTVFSDGRTNEFSHAREHGVTQENAENCKMKSL